MSNKLRLIYAAAHAGYDPSKVPLGGAAAVCERLVREWGGRQDIHLTLIGPGDGIHYEGIDYIKLPGSAPELVRLSEIKYADFSYRFENFVAETVKGIAKKEGTKNACFISNDISEAGDFSRIRRAGLPILTLYHVDVVEYFSKMYLGSLFHPERLTAFFERVSKGPFRVFIPRLLGLVFKKQRESLLYSGAVVVPSHAMKSVLLRCYPWVEPGRIHVIPWGGSSEKISPEEVESETRRLASFYGVRPSEAVLLTLSRISPEKGIDFLLEALILWEREGSVPPLHLFICGEAAYMQGQRYKTKLARLAGYLRKVKVHFPGYVAGPVKAGFLELANLYVFPSRHDSYGLTLVEAMQAGLPVLTSFHHSAPELVRDDSGQLVKWSRESEAPRVLLGALKSLLADPNRLAGMGRRAAEISRPWNFSSAAQRILELARNCIIDPCPPIRKNTPNRV